MFYVYTRENYPVFELAEGGYYVSASEIASCEEFYYLEDAMEKLTELVNEAKENGDTETRGSNLYGFIEDASGKHVLRLPWHSFNYNSYIGSGYDIAIACERPEDRPYQGYC